MLRQLVINNLAVIDRLSLDFDPGMTVLTGETGAGKSILLDALGLILGARADTGLIRGGADKTDITAIFVVEGHAALRQRLAALDIECEAELFIRRTISRDGRSRAYINNIPAPAQTLRELGRQLIDIHGQHAYQALAGAEAQRELLDQAGACQPLLERLRRAHAAWQTLTEQLRASQPEGAEIEAKRALLRYQIDELAALDIGEAEYTTVNEEYKRLANAQTILGACHQARDSLAESEDAVAARLGRCRQDIHGLRGFDDKLEGVATLLEGASIQLAEAVGELKHYIDQFDADTSRLAALEQRLDKLHELARKHKVKPVELAAHLARLAAELAQLEDGQEQSELLQQREAELRQEYAALALALHEARRRAATTMAAAITAKMQELGMGGEFSIQVEQLENEQPRAQGWDKVSFLVSANPGQPPRPINKVASGGELSRLSLAIQIIGAKDTGVPTLIFDEVDAGIGGGVAEIVGRLLRRLAEHRQILCVTHLAQVASCGHHHFRVAKTSENNATFTRADKLDQKERMDEVARMLAGMTITDESRANARRMLESA